MKYMRYWTPKYIVSLSIDSVGLHWKACTNDHDFHNKHLAELDWKTKDEAQADLDAIAEKLGLQEAGTKRPYINYPHD